MMMIGSFQGDTTDDDLESNDEELSYHQQDQHTQVSQFFQIWSSLPYLANHPRNVLTGNLKWLHI